MASSFVSDGEMMPNRYVTLMNGRRSNISDYFRYLFSHFTPSKRSASINQTADYGLARSNGIDKIETNNSFGRFFRFHHIMNRNRNKCVHCNWTWGSNRFIYHSQTKSNRRWIRFFLQFWPHGSWMDLDTRCSWIICYKIHLHSILVHVWWRLTKLEPI